MYKNTKIIHIIIDFINKIIYNVLTKTSKQNRIRSCHPATVDTMQTGRKVYGMRKRKEKTMDFEKFFKDLQKLEEKKRSLTA